MSKVNSANKEILIIHTWGLGDLILLTPVLNLVNKLHPEVRFTFLIFQRIAAKPIFHAPYEHEILYSGWKPSELYQTVLTLRKKKFYAAFFTSGVTVWKAGLLLSVLRAQQKVGEYSKLRFPLLNTYFLFHQEITRTESNYNLFKAVLELPKWKEAMSEQDKWQFRTTFYLTDTNKSFANNFLAVHSLQGKLLIGIHPGCMTKNKYKRWDKSYFITLISLLKSKYACEIIIIGGPDELEEAEFISKATASLLLSNEALDNVAAVIARLNYFINPDSGLGHVASCFNIKTLTIFGPGDERQTAPFSSNSHIIRKNLPCAPCIRKKNRICKVECLNQLTPDMVFDRFVELTNA